MNSIRAFIALDLSAGCRQAIAKAIRRLEPTCSGVKWVNAAQLHLTLHFLGDVLYSDIKHVCAAAQVAAEALDPFTIHLQGLGGFPNADRPRVIWVGVSEGHEQLVELQRALKEPLGELGYPSDKNVFRPHITIGRVKRFNELGNLSEAMLEFEDTDFGVSAVDELVVYQSDLHRSGPDYTPISEIELG